MDEAPPPYNHNPFRVIRLGEQGYLTELTHSVYSWAGIDMIIIPIGCKGIPTEPTKHFFSSLANRSGTYPYNLLAYDPYEGPLKGNVKRISLSLWAEGAY